jgi:hypothetical protein
MQPNELGTLIAQKKIGLTPNRCQADLRYNVNVLLLDAFHVGASFCINFDHVAGVTE